MSTRPKISVIITAYNYARYIKQSIESILNQTIDDFELIVVNDGSTDNTADILKKYNDHKKIEILNIKNIGLAAASNKGIKASKGKYIIRLDADDYFDENILLVESRILDIRPEIGMVYPDYYRVNKYGEVLECYRLLKVNDEVKLLDRSPLAAGAMYRRECYDEVGGYNENLRYQEDYDFWIRFINKYNVYNVNLPLMYYRQHPASMSTNQDARMKAKRFVKKRFVDKKGVRNNKEILCIMPIIAYNRYKNRLALEIVNNKPLMDFVINEAKKAKLLNRIIISTEDEQIAETAKQRGLEVPFIRPRDLAKPSTELDSIVLHCLNWLRDNQDYRPDIIVTLFYNCPLIQEKHITEAIDTILLYDVDTVISVIEDLTFHWQPGENGLKPVVYQKRFIREDKEVTYKEAGGIMVAKNPIGGFQSMIGKRISYIELQAYESLKVESDYSYFIFNKLIKENWPKK